MEPTPIINVLVLTDLMSEGEQLVTILRRGGLRVYAEAVRDETWLRERLPGHRWDLLFVHADNARIPMQQLGTLLRELQPDLFCLTFGSPSLQASLQATLQTRLRDRLDMPAAPACRQLAARQINDLVTTPPDTLLLDTLLEELGNLQTRRRLRHSASILTELQARHQLLLTGTSDAVAYLHDGMHVYLNAAYARLFGHDDRDVLMNTAFLDLLHDSQIDQARQLLRQQDPQGHHRLLGVDINGMPCELNLHCSKVIYQNEPCLQVIVHAAGTNYRPQSSAGQPRDVPPLETPVASTVVPIPQDSHTQQRLHQALENEDIHLLFQPIVGFTTSELQHYAVRFGLGKEDGTAPCSPTALCGHGQGERIDRLVLTRCLQLLRELHRPGLRLVVELTAGSIAQPDFLTWLRGQLAESPVQSAGLVLQISEMDIVESPSGQVEEFCRQLQALQLPLAVTHFGGSLEPFSHLPQRYASYVELDDSLTEGSDADTDRFGRLRDTVSRLQASGLKTISRVDSMMLLPALWKAGVCMVRGNCLQEACTRLEYAFVRDEEITLTALP